MRRRRAFAEPVVVTGRTRRRPSPTEACGRPRCPVRRWDRRRGSIVGQKPTGKASEPCQGEEMGSVAGPGGSRTLRTSGQGPGRPRALAPLGRGGGCSCCAA
uniref:Uncharacterized protein n=1 Tax=Mustela putorius furo TaxID=9669 RepID=M3Y5C2_MUSPF